MARNKDWNSYGRFLILPLLLVLTSQPACSRMYQPLKPDWEWPIMADRIYSFDLDQDGYEEIYTCTYMEDQGVIVGLNKTGHLVLDHWTVEGYLGQSDYKRPEYIEFVWVGDADFDTNLDILAGTSIKGGQVNMEILYKYERELDPGLYVKNVRKWYMHEARTMTSALGSDLDGNGFQEYVLTSLDGNVYIMSPERVMLKTITLPGSPWEALADDINKDSVKELVVGYFEGVVSTKLSGTVRWMFRTPKRVFDIDVTKEGDSVKCIVGASEDTLYCIDVNGTEKWRKEFPDAQEINGIATFDIDEDDAKDILVLLDKEIHAFDNEGNRKWVFGLPVAAKTIHTMDDQILLSGKKLTSYSLNDDYIHNEIATRYLNAAKAFYSNDACDDALKFAEMAKETFLEIDNTESLIECDNIIVHCSPSPEQTQEIALANEYFSLGKSHYEAGELVTAKTYLEKAFELYGKWNYRQETFETDALLQEIYAKLTTEGEDKAREYYLKAVDCLLNGNLEEAKTNANQALRIYTEIESDQGILKANELLSDVSRMENELLAGEYLETALSQIDNGEYGNASFHANKAKILYLSTGKSEKVEECDEIINRAKRFEEAELYYALAVEYYNNYSSYENATSYANLAKDIYMELNHSEGVFRADELMAEMRGTGLDDAMLFGMFLLAIIILILLAVLLKKRGAF